MTKKEQLLHEIKELPESVVDEVMDFVQFLKQKRGSVSSETMLLSEDSLKKEWLTEVEDEAWKHL